MFSMSKKKKINYIGCLALIFLSACGSNPSQEPSETGRLFDEWYLISMDGSKGSDKPLYKDFTIRIGKKQLSGKAVNHFSVNARINTDGTMQVDKIMRTTRMMPMGREYFLENQYFKIIPTLTHWKKANGKLMLTGAKGKLIFRQ